MGLININKIFKGAMVQCDTCSQWTHFACLNIDKCETPATGKPFACGGSLSAIAYA